MRKIKFRAWSKQHKTMFDISYLRYNGDQTLREVGHALGSTRNVIHVANNYILMQWTGLKDKNGTEIYEGDIVRGKYGKNGIVKNYEIRWLIGHFAAVDRNNITGDEHYYPIGLLEGEVIGNIYEHPHLLKEVKND